MDKNLHVYPLLIAAILMSISGHMHAQNDRVKTGKAEFDPVLYPRAIQDVPNTPEIAVPPKAKQGDATSPVPSKAGARNNLTGTELPASKLPASTTVAEEKIRIQDNVEAVKVDEVIPVYNTPSEVKAVKVSPSVNYQPRVIREDIHPAPVTESAYLSPSKRAYLLQYRQELEDEIQRNINNPDYSRADKLAELDKVNKLLNDK